MYWLYNVITTTFWEYVICGIKNKQWLNKKPTIIDSYIKLTTLTKEEASDIKKRIFYYTIMLFTGLPLIIMDYYICIYIWRY